MNRHDLQWLICSDSVKLLFTAGRLSDSYCAGESFSAPKIGSILSSNAPPDEQRASSTDECAALLDDGLSAEAIAWAPYIDGARVRDHLALYSAKGRSGVEFPAK